MRRKMTDEDKALVEDINNHKKRAYDVRVKDQEVYEVIHWPVCWMFESYINYAITHAAETILEQEKETGKKVSQKDITTIFAKHLSEELSNVQTPDRIEQLVGFYWEHEYGRERRIVTEKQAKKSPK